MRFGFSESRGGGESEEKSLSQKDRDDLSERAAVTSCFRFTYRSIMYIDD